MGAKHIIIQDHSRPESNSNDIVSYIPHTQLHCQIAV